MSKKHRRAERRMIALRNLLNTLLPRSQWLHQDGCNSFEETGTMECDCDAEPLGLTDKEHRRIARIRAEIGVLRSRLTPEQAERSMA